VSRGRRFWSNVLAVAYRETIVLRHDPSFIGVVLAQPIMLLVLFGYVLSNEPANVPWGVLDRSHSAPARRLVQDIQATGYFEPPRTVGGYEEARDLLRRGRLLAVLVIDDRFAADLERGGPEVQLLLDGSDPLSAARVGGYIGEVASGFDTRVGVVQRPPPGPVQPDGPVDVRQRFRFNPTLSDRRFFLAALAGMLLTNICLSATALGLVGERESGTFEQILAQPITSIEIVLGKLVPYVVVCYGLLVFSTLATGVLFGIWPRGGMVTVLVATLPFVLASLGIGVLVSALARSSAQGVFLTVFFIMPSFVLSGSMFAYQLMPHGVREIGALFPLRWYQIALRRIVERGAGLAEVAGPIGALLALFAILLVLIRWRMNPRLG
jgi:ABC-2 type transport system permease protein